MRHLSVIAACVAAGAALTAAGFYAGRSIGHPGASSPAAPAMPSSNAEERKVLYWHDPMVPGPRFERPGKSPFMDMQLVPVYADEGADSGVKVSPTIQQNLGIRLAPVRRVELSASFDAVGSVQFDERLSVAVQTRVPGYVEHLSVRAPMERVRRGQALATVYAPEWLGPLNELSALKRAGVSEELIAAARARTQVLSIPTELVRQAEDGGAPNGRFVLTAPAAGVIAELGVREGMAVSPGTSLFRIAGLERVWAVAEIPEAQAVRLTPGQVVQARLQADPTQAFAGKLTELLPEISANTRTLKARFEIDNRNGKLIPGMLLRLEVTGPTSVRLVVPTEAIIRTGKRAVLLVRNERGSFESRDVTVGPEIGDDIEVTQGLAEGDQVVASGQFLIDSEARLRSVTGNLVAPPPASAWAASMPVAPPSRPESTGASK